MAERKTVILLVPQDVKPGSVDPSGNVVTETKLYISEATGIAVMDVKFRDGSSDAITWPLGTGWTVDGVTA